MTYSRHGVSAFNTSVLRGVRVGDVRSSCGTARHRAAAGAGATGASVLVDGDLNNSHSSFNGICDEQASGSINLLILLLDVLRNLLQNLLVARLHTKEYQVSSSTG